MGCGSEPPAWRELVRSPTVLGGWAKRRIPDPGPASAYTWPPELKCVGEVARAHPGPAPGATCTRCWSAFHLRGTMSRDLFIAPSRRHDLCRIASCRRCPPDRSLRQDGPWIFDGRWNLSGPRTDRQGGIQPEPTKKRGLARLMRGTPPFTVKCRNAKVSGVWAVAKFATPPSLVTD